jgi:cob(I)alamin adenosyltransferase
VLVFWFSTQWSVVSMGGKDAVSTHMQRTLAAAEVQGLQLYRRAATEANLAPQLQTLSQNFTDLARREAGGAFSGLRGEGDVVATLRNTSELFANLATSVAAVDKESRQNYDHARELIGQARASAARIESADISDGEEVRKYNLEFANRLGDINEVMARMAQTSSIPFVRVVNRNLTALTMSAKADDRPEQKAAVDRLKALVDAAQSVIGQLTVASDTDEVNVQLFTMLSTQRAIWKYWQDILYAWAGATTLDFAPLFFMVLLAIAYDVERESITSRKRVGTSQYGSDTDQQESPEDFEWRSLSRPVSTRD